jgi:hypothetical protein
MSYPRTLDHIKEGHVIINKDTCVRHHWGDTQTLTVIKQKYKWSLHFIWIIHRK